MKKSMLLLTLILIVFLQYSCKKDEVNLSKKELISVNTWKIVSKALSPPASMGGITIDDIIILDSDDQRNYSYKFNTDGTMVQYNQLNEEIFRTSWSLNTDETQLIYNPGIVYTYTMVGDFTLSSMAIETVTADKMVAKVQYNFLGTEYLATFIYEPK